MEKEEIKALTETSARSKSNTRRIEKLEEVVDAIHGFAKNLAVMNVNIEGMNNTLVNLVGRVTSIENREVNEVRKTKWELKRSIINTLVGVMIGGVFAYVMMVINMM
jgi:hypothetical protein